MLNVKKALAKLLKTPMIIEQGTDGMWTYRKWSDGTAECWGYFTTSKTFSAWGSAYSTDVSPGPNYPAGLFTGVPLVFANASAIGANTVSSVNASAGTKDVGPSITLVRGTSPGTDAKTIVARYHSIGTWK